MRSHQTSTEPQTLAEQRAEDTQYHRRILHDLIEMGADLARLVHQQAKAATPASAEPQDVAVAFERISRAVRRTIVLAQKLTEPVAAAADHAVQHRVAARRRIIRAVEDAIQHDADGTEAESRHADLRDRLDGPDLDDDIDDRPVADIIADICRDLGLAALPGTHPWKRRTSQDVAALCTLAAAARAAPDFTAHPIFVRAMPPRTWTGRDPPANAAEPGATLRPCTPCRHDSWIRPPAPA